jgi:hypothetical protein
MHRSLDGYRSQMSLLADEVRSLIEKACDLSPYRVMQIAQVGL